MRIGSLFSGAGGLDMAVENVFSGEVIWQTEIDKAASKVLAYRFPCAPNLGDITRIDWKTVEPVDVLCGGFPCQDVSAAGKRAGIKAGTRSGLWSVFAEAIDQLRPPLVVIENVRGLLSAQAHRNVEPDKGTVGDRPDGPVLRALGAVLGDLADLGYDAQWTTVAAADIGAPHRRERVFIVAHSAEQLGAKGPWSDGGQQAVVSAGPGADSGDHAGDSSPGVQFVGRGSGSVSDDAADSSSDGWVEGRPESTRLKRGSDAAIGGNEPGVALLPTPCAQQSGCSPEDHLRKKPGRKVVTDLAILVENGLLETGGALLPTPRASDPCGAESRSSEGFRPQLGEVVRELCQADKVISTEDDGAMSILTTDSGKDQTVVVTSDGDGVAVNVGSGESSHSSVLAPDLAGTKLDLLPTPRSSDCFGSGVHGDGGMDLRTTISLLPTPKASDGEFATPRTSGRPVEKSTHLQTIASLTYQWGKYAAAIARWEQIAGPAPTPTEPNRNGKPRLNPAFSEWMMGWPAGWVTDPGIGISRNDQLKIIGNGVCPQQAIAALRYLLTVAKVAA